MHVLIIYVQEKLNFLGLRSKSIKNWILELNSLRYRNHHSKITTSDDNRYILLSNMLLLRPVNLSIYLILQLQQYFCLWRLDIPSLTAYFSEPTATFPSFANPLQIRQLNIIWKKFLIQWFFWIIQRIINAVKLYTKKYHHHYPTIITIITPPALNFLGT